ncbi:MAG: phosphoenolpyruvate--protein phosphotransferase [Eubacteriales bacterium]|nr:phosphoenolpyruvate--protein phosphotransferase [Eubacteriales bacterium]
MAKIQASKTFSRGFADGPIFRYVKSAKAPLQQAVDTPAEELEKFKQAVANASTDLEKLAANSEIFTGHLAIVNDPYLASKIEEKIMSGKGAIAAVQLASEEVAAEFKAIPDPYLSERADDVKDIGQRLLAELSGTKGNPFDDLVEPSIIVARELLPSDTALLPLDLVLGFLTEVGGVTSHVAIISKSLGLPALVGVPNLLAETEGHDHLAFNAASGEIWIDPKGDEQREYQIAKEQYLESEVLLQELANAPAITQDGRKLKVYANLGNSADIAAAKEKKPDGVGLFRSEFLFMDGQDWPDEERQYQVYKAALEALDGGEMILRTLDIGGDKDLPYYDFPTEDNPFLGWRAIRFCLDRREIFKTQIKAALRAAAHGPLKLMYPMIVSVDELREAKLVAAEAESELAARAVAFSPVPQGIMVETPAAVYMARELAKEADFFSIGTNDLTQYMLAADRGNEALQELYNPLHPAVIRAIAETIEAGHEAGIEVGVCGEFASREDVCELLLGLGLDEYSMSLSDIPKIKKRLMELDYGMAQEMAANCLKLQTTAEVEGYLRNLLD